MHRRRLLIFLSTFITVVIYAFLGYMLLLTERPESLTPLQRLLVDVLPHVIALVNSIALLSLLLGWSSIRKQRVDSHRLFMLVAVLLIMLFLVMYVTRISLGGVKRFTGPEPVYLYVYLPMLTVHVVLSIASVPLVVYNALSGLLLRIEEIPSTAHPKVGRIAVYAWSVSLALGIAVYFMLNYPSLWGALAD